MIEVNYCDYCICYIFLSYTRTKFVSACSWHEQTDIELTNCIVVFDMQYCDVLSCVRVYQISPRHSPMLASPCGHTMCEECCYRQCYCPVCHCFIEARLINDALQRVVVDHHLSQQQLQQSTDSESAFMTLCYYYYYDYDYD